MPRSKFLLCDVLALLICIAIAVALVASVLALLCFFNVKLDQGTSAMIGILIGFIVTVFLHDEIEDYLLEKIWR